MTTYSRNRLARFIDVANLSAFCSVLCGLFLCSEAHASDVKLIIVDGGYEYPKVPIFAIGIDVDGSLGPMEGGDPLSDKDLRKLLKWTWKIDNKQVCLLRIHCGIEEVVSVKTLGEVLERLRSLSEPDTPTIIYLYLRELRVQKKCSVAPVPQMALPVHGNRPKQCAEGYRSLERQRRILGRRASGNGLRSVGQRFRR
jgi:hypothetical protein